MGRRTKHILTTAALFSLAAAISGGAAAATGKGDAAEAKAMLERAVAAVKADKAKALDMFNNGESDFYDKEHDVFPFCFTKSDGKIVATQTKQALGKDVRTFKDKSGKAFGEELYNDAKDGQVSEVSYTFGKPGAEQTPVPKVSFVTGVADLGCAVGIYK